MSTLNIVSDLLSNNHLDALAILPGPTLTYITGLHFHPGERPVTLLISATEACLILPALEAGKGSLSAIPLRIITFSDNPDTWQAAFNQAISSMNLHHAHIGVESTGMRFQEAQFLIKASADAQLINADNLIGTLRIQKNSSEIQAVQQAVKIAEQALMATLPIIKPGLTEAELALELSINLIRNGSLSGSSFDPIIASGPNGANPHATVSDRSLQNGDLLVIDWGATFNGYISDLTRTFAIGSIHPELEKIVEVVHQANTAGRMACQPNISAGKVDQQTRKVIEQSGYGEFFTHRTGHGIGMQVHEPPYIFAENDLILQPGMMFTIEPGIYLPGRAGARIEDNVVITEEGCEVLSSLPRELIHLPISG